MQNQILQQLAVGAGLLLLGASGWLLPYRWNLLRLKRLVAGLLPEHVQVLVPKIVGTVLGLAGAAILIGTAVVGEFK